MRIKVDENLPVDVAVFFVKSGLNAETVCSEGMGGCTDRNLIALCKNEKRILITLDNHFSNIRAYPPNECCGIIVLRIANQSKPSILSLLDKLLVLMRKESDMSNRLWIVEEDRVRVRW
jgi:predicted nuclease of predicted toxin-antitoxin system